MQMSHGRVSRRPGLPHGRAAGWGRLASLRPYVEACSCGHAARTAGPLQ